MNSRYRIPPPVDDSKPGNLWRAWTLDPTCSRTHAIEEAIHEAGRYLTSRELVTVLCKPDTPSWMRRDVLVACTGMTTKTGVLKRKKFRINGRNSTCFRIADQAVMPHGAAAFIPFFTRQAKARAAEREALAARRAAERERTYAPVNHNALIRAHHPDSWDLVRTAMDRANVPAALADDIQQDLFLALLDGSATTLDDLTATARRAKTATFRLSALSRFTVALDRPAFDDDPGGDRLIDRLTENDLAVGYR